MVRNCALFVSQMFYSGGGKVFQLMPQLANQSHLFCQGIRSNSLKKEKKCPPLIRCSLIVKEKYGVYVSLWLPVGHNMQWEGADSTDSF